MARKHPNAHLALREHSSLVSNAIRSLMQKSLTAIHYDITREDVELAMYGDKLDAARELLPMWACSITQGFGMTYEQLGGVTLRVQPGNGALPLVPYNKWQGSDDARFTLVNKVEAVADRIRLTRKQWQDVYTAFDYVNSNCKNPNHLRSMWPPVLQLLEYHGYNMLAEEMGAYKAYAPFMDLTATEVENMRNTAAIVGMAVMLPDMEPCTSFVQVRV